MKLIPSTKYYYACEDGHIWRNGTRRIPGSNGRGYLRIKLSVDGVATDGYVHRLVCEAYHGPCPPTLQCRHLNGNRQDNRPSNLEWSTKAINEADKRKHGTLQLGQAHHRAKLTDATVIAARMRAANGEQVADIAADLGVSYQCLLSAVAGRRYSHLPGAPKLVKGGQRRMLMRKAIREGKPPEFYIASITSTGHRDSATTRGIYSHQTPEFSAPASRAVGLKIVGKGST